MSIDLVLTAMKLICAMEKSTRQPTLRNVLIKLACNSTY